MSTDIALRAIAFAEAPTLSVGIALIAKHRMELEAAERQAELKQLPVTSEGAATERALAKIAEASEPIHVLDKVA